ncbi:MAG TPA: kelch repeat-containing protein [Anaerolineae bacterium]|nr:kelch repeat-containing protein [Anaerolineae bacterium]
MKNTAFRRPRAFMVGSALLLTAAASTQLPPMQAQIGGCRWEADGRLPVPVADAAGDVDALRGMAYVHGGVDRDGVVRNEVFRVDLKSGAVERMITSGGNVTRWAHGAALVDPGGKPQLLILGGNTATADDFPAEKRVYTLDLAGSRWAITPVTGGMPAVQDQAVAFDPLHKVLVMQGGRTSNGVDGISVPQGETFVLDPATGQLTRGQRDGPALYGHTMVYDAGRKRMLVYGGTPDGKKGSPLVWELSLEAAPDRGVWRAVSVSGAIPQPRFNHGAAYDAARQAMVIFGGQKIQNDSLDDTWALDLSTSGLAVWRDLAAPHQKRASVLMLYDPIRGDVLQISGGRPLGDQSSRDIFRLVCNAVPTATDDAPPIIAPTQLPTAMPDPTATPDARVPTPTEHPTNLPPPVTIGTPTSTTPPPVGSPTGPAPTASPPPTGGAAPTEPERRPAPAGRILLPLLLLRSPIQADPGKPADPASTPPPTPAIAPPTATPPGCVIAEVEPNDRLTDTWDRPPLCPDLPAIGILDQGDGGDYLRVTLAEGGRLQVGLADIPSGRDYDLLLYNYEGQSLGSSQQPGNLPESLIADVAAGEYAIRVYPSIGRSLQPYEIRWRIAP